jgi:hypothetical protein
MGLREEYAEDEKLLLLGKKPYKGRPNALNDKIFAAYVKAVYFLLADKAFIDAGLKLLDAALIQEVGGENAKVGAVTYFGLLEKYFGLEYGKDKDREKHPEKDTKTFHHQYKGALVRVLHASQTKGGFSVEKQIIIAKLTDTASFENIKEFAKLQQAAQHFKDINAGPEHGEYTHQIQWYFLTELWSEVQTRMAEEFHATAGYYPDPIDYYDEPFSVMWRVGETGTAAVGLWPMLFDRVTESVNGVYLQSKSTELEGRCPETLHRYMRHVKSPCPLLGAFLRARYKKRGTETTNDFNYYKSKTSSGKFDDFNKIGYITKK